MFNLNDGAKALSVGWMFLVSFILASDVTVSADFKLEAGVVSSGSGKLSGGRYDMVGTVAQPVVGQSAGGRFYISSGFWAMDIQGFVEPGVLLYVEQQAGNIALFWPKSDKTYVIESTSSLNPPVLWQPVSTPLFDIGPDRVAFIPLSIVAHGAHLFRLREVVN